MMKTKQPTDGLQFLNSSHDFNFSVVLVQYMNDLTFNCNITVFNFWNTDDADPGGYSDLSWTGVCRSSLKNPYPSLRVILPEKGTHF